MSDPNLNAISTISDLESTIESLFDQIRAFDESQQLEKAIAIINELRTYLAPARYRTVVQLEEGGKKKRSTASAHNFHHDTCEVVLYFDPLVEPKSLAQPTSPATQVLQMPAAPDPTPIAVTSNVKLEVQQCCEALAEAEKAGKQFISLKWFRDMYLAALPHLWARNVDERQRVLTAAIDSGAVFIKKIPNPRSPMYPTTTLTLNKTSNVVAIPSRFNPVPIHGEAASASLLKDRGDH